MSRLTSVPQIMVAPNGARRGKADHPALPVTIAETVAAAKACYAAGAQALHAHVRDATGAHSLDIGAYRALLDHMAEEVPDLPVQITTEAVGQFSPAEQRATVLALKPEGASVALREMWPEGEDGKEARAFYEACAREGIAIQHISYHPSELARLLKLMRSGEIPGPHHAIVVLGQYGSQTPATPEDLSPFLDLLHDHPDPIDWAACAFGPQETACLLAAHRAGGKMRVGFENNLYNADGTLAVDNAQRVSELVRALESLAVP